MSLENTDTNSTYEKQMIPDGDYNFKVISAKRVEKVNGLYEWELSCDDGSDYSVNLFKNEMGPLLRVLGCNETEKGKFTWDTVEVEGKWFGATAYQTPDKKDPTVIRQKLKDFKTTSQNADIQAAAKKNDTPF
jgi:hypothetical protein